MHGSRCHESQAVLLAGCVAGSLAWAGADRESVSERVHGSPLRSRPFAQVNNRDPSELRPLQAVPVPVPPSTAGTPEETETKLRRPFAQDQ